MATTPLTIANNEKGEFTVCIENSTKMENIAVLGSGNFGLAVAKRLIKGI